MNVNTDFANQDSSQLLNKHLTPSCKILLDRFIVINSSRIFLDRLTIQRPVDDLSTKRGDFWPKDSLTHSVIYCMIACIVDLHWSLKINLTKNVLIELFIFCSAIYYKINVPLDQFNIIHWNSLTDIFIELLHYLVDCCLSKFHDSLPEELTDSTTQGSVAHAKFLYIGSRCITPNFMEW